MRSWSRPTLDVRVAPISALRLPSGSLVVSNAYNRRQWPDAVPVDAFERLERKPGDEAYYPAGIYASAAEAKR